MRPTIKMGAALPLIATLSACSGSPASSDTPTVKKPAYFYYAVDVSNSTQNMNNPVVAQAIERRIGSDLRKVVQLGDTIRVYESGARSANRLVSQPAIVTDYNLRVPAAITMLTGQMHEIAARYHQDGGDNATNLVLSLEAMHPDCSSGRSTVTLVTDGLEESDAVSTSRALNADRPVVLPAPSSGFLAKCRVILLGFGLTEDPSSAKGQLLPERQLASLRLAWTTFLQSAAVRPEDIEFVSAL